MTFLLYLITSGFFLWLAHRQVLPLTRAAALVLVLLPLCFTGRALLTGAVYGPVDLPYTSEPLSVMKGDYGIDQLHNGILSDLYTQMIPWRKAVQYAYAHREWPLWNRFILSGDILASAGQPAAYSPLTLLACLLPVAQSLTFSAAIAFFLAGLGSFLLARELGCREVAAMIAAAGWMYSTSLAFFILWSLSSAWLWFPLVLLGIRRAVRTPSVHSGALLLFSFVMLLLAGHPETALHVVFAGALYLVYELGATGKAILPALVVSASAGVAALALSAIYILPVLEAAPQTIEHEFRKNVFATTLRGVHWQESMARLVVDVIPYLHVRDWKLPHARHIDFDTAAAGSVILALALYALWRVRSRDARFFALLLLFGLLARAEWTPFMRLLARLPLFDMTLNERFSFAAAGCLAILAALGVDELIRRGGDRLLASTSTALLLVLGSLTWWVTTHNVVTANVPPWSRYKIAAELGGLACLIVLAFSRSPRSFRYVIPALLGVLLVQRVMCEGDVYPTIPARAAYPPVPLFEVLKHVREPFRIVGQGMTFVPGTSALYELEDVRGYEAMTFRRYFETYGIWCVHQPIFFNRINDLSRPFLSFLNVRYAVTWEAGPVPEGWKEVARYRASKLLENTRVMERAFVPRTVRFGRGPDETLDEMNGEQDFRQRAWIDAPI
ncbi:MAG: YfhO family protein, partial [Acidobacteriota bacterium]